MSWLFFPFSWLSRVRQWLHSANTSVSTTILLGIIASANVIWGYPLGPLFSSLVVLLLLAGILNRIYFPLFDLETESTSQVQCGNLFSVVCILRNRRNITLYDLEIDLEEKLPGVQIDWTPKFIQSIVPNGTAKFTLSGLATRRGIHRLPAIQIQTRFPFGVFRKQQIVCPEGTLVVTPRLLPVHRFDPIRAGCLSVISRKVAPNAGGTFEYLGSREWMPTLPVRRWDFAAWARLGKPVAREYESSGAIHAVIWVDVSRDEVDAGRSNRQVKRGELDFYEHIEAVYSLAASLIQMLDARGIGCRLYLSCDSDAKIAGQAPGVLPVPHLMRRLAAGGTNTGRESHESLERLAGSIGDADWLLMVMSKTTEDSKRFASKGERGFDGVFVQQISIGRSLEIESAPFRRAAQRSGENNGRREGLRSSGGDNVRSKGKEGRS